MDFTAAQWLLGLYANVDVFLVVFVRVLGFFIILPVMSGQNLPVMARLGLALAIALLAFTTNVIELPPYTFTVVGFAVLLIQEFIIGFIIGIVVMFFFSIFHFVGQLVDFQMGFAMVSVADPFTQQQLPITGNLYFLIVSVFYVVSGALEYTIGLLFETFNRIGPGRGDVLGNESIAFFAMRIMVDFFELGLRIALPVVGTVMIVDIVLGILVKAVPQMNVFVVGLPLKVLIGLIIIFLTLPLLQPIFSVIMRDVIIFIGEMIGGMIP